MAGRVQRALLLGDTHGDVAWFKQACARARVRGCEVILQLGDFGFWEHLPDDTWLDDCARHLERTERACIWIDGNHENHQLLRQRYGPGGERHELTEDGLWVIRPGLYHAPRGHLWTMGGRSFMALGGAVSVDQRGRITGHSWWPEESITWDDVDRCLEAGSQLAGQRLDVLLSHDVPEGTPSLPPRETYWLDSRATQANRRMLRTVVDKLSPRLVAHGHYHVRNSAQLDDTRVEGFACEWRPGAHAVLHLSSLNVGR